MKLSKLSTAVLIALSSSQAYATTELDQVIVSANKTAQTLDQITSNVHIITSEEIEAKHYNTLSEALNQISGVSFTRNGGLGTTTNIFMRGSSNNRLLILIDGVRTNDPSSTNGSNIADIVMSNIERIEVIKGAQSGVWGSDAAAGVINIITKENKTTAINIEYGAYNTRKATLSTGTKIDRTSLSLNVQRLETDGFSAQAPADTDIDLYEDDPYQNTNIIGKVKFDIDQDSSISLTHNYTDAQNSYDDYNAPDSTKRATSETNLTSLEYQKNDTNIVLQQSLFRAEQLDGTAADIVNGETQSLQITHNIDNLLLGASRTLNRAKVDKYATTDNENNHSNSAFATYHHKFGNIVFNEALRLDDYSNFGSKVTGKLGAKIPIDSDSSISVNYGTAYNAPSLIQIVNPWGTENPDLKPENSAEASVGYQNKAFTISFFEKRVEDLIDWDSGQYQNFTGATQIRGYEAEYKLAFDSVELAANYTHLHTEKSDGSPLARRPDDQVGLDINWYATDKLDININGQYIGQRSEENSTQNYSVWNSALNYKINPVFSTYLKVDNLFDTYYQVVDGYATAERSAYLGVNANF